MARSLCGSGSVRSITLLSAIVEKNDRCEHVAALSAKPADLPADRGARAVLDKKPSLASSQSAPMR